MTVASDPERYRTLLPAVAHSHIRIAVTDDFFAREDSATLERIGIDWTFDAWTRARCTPNDIATLEHDGPALRRDA